ncbi:hypothetical protein [Burkholderia gladioli]|uniref:hypothetical protein n=1 Tax=Burkholderia gladioli TaxID=28095 RepID=UPI00163F7BC0|nr:hypothetical protein [Burkholderia gladioli]MBU9426453.1 hypothetical protein [Burkholderia gladioli]MDN8063414.1 hypothetical protein [Burkholderia gladioli]
MNEKLWTVARFPSGAWSFGGKPDDPAYSKCEIWQIAATTGNEAKKKAQAKRSRDHKRASAKARTEAVKIRYGA